MKYAAVTSLVHWLITKMEYLKAKLTDALVGHFGKDYRRIEHALTVMKWAERIWESEGGNYNVVISAGLLHDVGIKEAEKIYGYNNGKLQEQYGPPIARKMMEDIGMEQGEIDETCNIIALHHTASGFPGCNFPILWDADMIVNIGDELKDEKKDKLISIIQKSFRTKTGMELAISVLVK